MALQTKTITANGSKGHHKFTFTVTENSTSVADNSSSAMWSLKISPIVKGFDWVSNSGKVKYSVTFNGTTYSGAIKTYDGTSTVTIKSGTATVEHDADGSKTLSFSFSITDSTGWSFAPGNASKTGTMALTAIPRQATITAAPNFTDEENPTITYSNPAGAAVTSLDVRIRLDTLTEKALPYKPVDPTGTTFTYELSEEDRDFLRNATPERNTLKVGFCLRTTFGDTLAQVEHISEVWCTMSIVNALPRLNPTITESNKDVLALNRGTAMVRYYSNAQVDSGAKALKGATITSQSITCGGATIKDGSGTFVGVQSSDFVFTVTDSRGSTKTQPVSVLFVEYVKPTCSIGNSKPDTDGNFTLIATGVCFNGEITGAGANELLVQYCYKASGGTYSDWMDMVVTRDGNAYTATANLTGLDYKTTYYFQCKASDLVDTVTTPVMTIKAMPVFDWGENDFNFNVPVRAPSLALGGVALDYIVEQGTLNGWTYRKWNSGLAECWYRKEHTVIISDTWGNLYAGTSATGRTPYPFVFKEKPHETVTIKSSLGAAFAACSSGGLGDNTVSHTASYNAIRPSAMAEESVVFFEYYVVGFWK